MEGRVTHVNGVRGDVRNIGKEVPSGKVSNLHTAGDAAVCEGDDAPVSIGRAPFVNNGDVSKNLCAQDLNLEAVPAGGVDRQRAIPNVRVAHAEVRIRPVVVERVHVGAFVGKLL